MDHILQYFAPKKGSGRIKKVNLFAVCNYSEADEDIPKMSTNFGSAIPYLLKQLKNQNKK